MLSFLGPAVLEFSVLEFVGCLVLEILGPVVFPLCINNRPDDVI